MKIVVIGGTGLIGSKTVAILRQGGHEVDLTRSSSEPLLTARRNEGDGCQLGETKEIDPRLPCSACGRDVPLSEAVVPEATDYVAYFCGLDYYAQWHSRAEAFLERVIA